MKDIGDTYIKNVGIRLIIGAIVLFVGFFTAIFNDFQRNGLTGVGVRLKLIAPTATPRLPTYDEAEWLKRFGENIKALNTDFDAATAYYDKLKNNINLYDDSQWQADSKAAIQKVSQSADAIIVMKAPFRLSKAQAAINDMPYYIIRYWTLYPESINKRDKLMFDNAVEQLRLASAAKSLALEEIKQLYD